MHTKDFEIDGRKKGPDSRFSSNRSPGCPNTEKGCSKKCRPSAISSDVGTNDGVSGVARANSFARAAHVRQRDYFNGDMLALAAEQPLSSHSVATQ